MNRKKVSTPMASSTGPLFLWCPFCILSTKRAKTMSIWLLITITTPEKIPIAKPDWYYQGQREERDEEPGAW
jgi:hypothetical protein